MKELIIWHFYKSNKILTIINPYMSERNYNERGKSREPKVLSVKESVQNPDGQASPRLPQSVYL